MELNEIPKNWKHHLPVGVSEHTYTTRAEIDAFLEGVNLAEDIDVETGDPFERKGRWVVRVRVGEWDDELWSIEHNG